MKKIILSAVLAGVAAIAGAEVTFDLFNDSALYGYLDNQPGPLSYTNSGLVATFEGFGGVMNRTTSGFGIDAAGSGDTSYALDFSEALKITFDQNVTITGLDFRNFDDGEGIKVIIGSVTNVIVWADLSNQTSDLITNLFWNVSSGTTVSFGVVGAAGIIAADSITVVPEPATLVLLGLGGVAAIVSRRASRK